MLWEENYQEKQIYFLSLLIYLIETSAPMRHLEKHQLDSLAQMYN